MSQLFNFIPKCKVLTAITTVRFVDALLAGTFEMVIVTFTDHFVRSIAALFDTLNAKH